VPPRPFVHLHTHTELSLFDGCGKQADFVKKAKALGCPAIGITEHGSMRGITRQRAACADVGIKPIYGIEFYLCEDHARRGLSPEDEKRVTAGLSRAERSEAIYQEEVRQGIRDRNHLTVLAKTDEGLKNLFRLSSLAWIRGFYKKPRIDWAALEQHREGLIVLSGCLSGPVAKPVLDGDPKGALEKVEQLHAWFGDDFYLEVMPHRLEKQVKVNKALTQIAGSMGLPLVATQDAHWIGPDDCEAQQALLCIHTRDVLSNPNRFKFETDDFYLQGRAEMEMAFARNHGFMSKDVLRRALDATLEIAEKVTAQLRSDKFAALIPSPGIPDEFQADEFRFLQHLCMEGWERRQIVRRAAQRATHVGRSERALEHEYLARLKHELRTIRERKVVRYFLVIWDMYEYARAQRIAIGPGRGSAAGSLVAYLLGLTDLDPLEHGLLFERFLAPGRVDLPDLDCDFESRRRDEILAYLRRKYGEDRTAQIATIGTMAGKACLRDLGRVLEIPIREIDEVAATIEARKKGDERVHATIEDAFAEVQVCQQFNERHPKVLQLAKKLEGQARTLGVHAAGVVVSPVPLTDVCPLETRISPGKKKDEPVVVTAVDMHGVAELGLLKIDVLAVRNLDAIDDCKRMVHERHGVEIDFDAIDHNDPVVLQRFTDTDFTGIFQFDTPAARRLCQGVVFEKFEDVTTLVALDRPGTAQSGLAAEFIKRKADPDARVSIHPTVDEACADTLGVIVYQEHVMRILREVGFTPEETDVLRRKIGKSFGKETLAKERGKFIELALKKGFSRALAEELIDQISCFGGYGFNKSHAASYALTGYRQMWLKVYYPVEYMWSLLCNEPELEEVARLSKQTRRMGIAVRPPDVNTATARWTIDGETIVGALSDLKGVGPAAIESILAARPFKSFVDFARRVDRRRVNRRVVEVLLRAGAMSELVLNQRWTLEHLPELWDLAIKERWPELARRLAASSEEPDWTEAEASAEAAKVSPLSEDRRIEAQDDFVATLAVEFSRPSEEGFWDRGHAYILGVVRALKVGRDKNGSATQYAYLALEARDGEELRVRLDGDVFECFREVAVVGALVAVHVGISAKWRSLRGQYLVDLPTMRRKLEAGEALSTFEGMLTHEHHPVAPLSSRDISQQARRGGVVKVVGLITHVYRKRDKKKREMAFFGLQGFAGYLDCLAFASTWEESQEKIRPGVVVSLELSCDGSSMILENIF
jgi:DNA polymerase-3 subunit alpha